MCLVKFFTCRMDFFKIWVKIQDISNIRKVANPVSLFEHCCLSVGPPA